MAGDLPNINVFGSMSPLERVLDYHLKRHGVLAANVTNANTPTYKPKDVVFDEAMAAASGLTSTDTAHRAGTGDQSGFRVVEDPNPVNIDGNGVRLEKAMAQLGGNKIRYNTGLAILRKELGMLKYAASNGGA